MSEMINSRVPMPSAIVLRLQKWLESRDASGPGKPEAEKETETFVIDTLLGVLRHSERVPEQYRKRFLSGLGRLRSRFGAKDHSLDQELRTIIEAHS